MASYKQSGKLKYRNYLAASLGYQTDWFANGYQILYIKIRSIFKIRIFGKEGNNSSNCVCKLTKKTPC